MRSDESKLYGLKELKNFKIILKLLLIIAFWESLIMLTLEQVGHISPLIAGILDASALTFFSGLSIWFFIVNPEKKQALKHFKQSVHLVEQEIAAIDQVAIITATDPGGKINYSNKNFQVLTGYMQEELIGRNHNIIKSGFHPPEFYRDMWKTLQEKKAWRGQICNKTKSGEIYWVDSYIVPILDAQGEIYKYVSFKFDITHNKTNEALLETEKIKNIKLARLSAIGEMAGGIAHEINNPLTIVSGLLTMISMKLNSKNPTEEIPKILISIEKTQAQVSRMTKIISGLREFSKTDETQAFEKIQLNSVIKNVTDLVNDKLDNLAINLESKIQDITFTANQLQIEQVILSLLNNSIEAINKLPHPWIKIEVQIFKDYFEISITDSGPGLSPEVAQSVMQPFFTTKDIGKGTGLGLSISHEIIQRHGGELYIDSHSANTRFVIKLPLQTY